MSTLAATIRQIDAAWSEADALPDNTPRVDGLRRQLAAALAFAEGIAEQLRDREPPRPDRKRVSWPFQEEGH